jgi:putative peptide zinc metalloprotease protein
LFVMTDPDDKPGRYVRRGDVLGYTLPDSGARIVRATVAQEDIDLIRHGMTGASVKPAGWMDQPFAVRSVREVPAGGDKLPSAALGTTGGGGTLVDPRDEHGMTTLSRVFQVDLTLVDPIPRAGYGGRVHVRFDHEWEPLGAHFWRRLQQLLLARVQF